MNRYQGQCLCGACCYTIVTEQKPKAVYFCHCSRCRKETGTMYGANVFFKKAQLLWEKGENNITSFTLEKTRKQRAFCNICGSPLPRRGKEDEVILPAGTLDDDTSLAPTAHIFYGSRSSLEDKLMSLKQYDELPKVD
ncbi:GFA family protein [Legionella nagasakiensis]|uniref:GFA family protein n=1 Tax=Legionella nagasakiensis TaxID=535290 RepID=UPI001055D022|nr:GFA family protein [Legionella nagasakiensis]